MATTLTRQHVEDLLVASRRDGNEVTADACETILCCTHAIGGEQFFSGQHQPDVLAAARFVAGLLGVTLADCF